MEANTKGIPVFVSLVRPEHRIMLGADRVLVIFLGMIVACFLMVLPWTKLSLSISAMLALIGHPSLVALCKYDPLWRPIMFRHIRYQSFYPAAAHPTARISKPKPAIPTARECH